MGSDAVVVIGGGVGPMAGVELHAKIIENTLSDGTDQSHLTVHHYSCSESIPDRTEYLLGLASGGARVIPAAADPAAAMARVFEAASLALRGRAAVGGVPCNTFHARPIFDRFEAMLRSSGVDIRIVDMLEESMRLLGSRLGSPRGRKVGLLCTTGTRRSGVYDGLLSAAGYEALYVSEADQELLHGAIYDRVWGLKATPVPSERAVETVRALALALVEAEAAAVMVACTELPLAMPGTEFNGVPLVDPVLALARALVREASPGKLRPLSV